MDNKDKIIESAEELKRGFRTAEQREKGCNASQ